jgi:hypothetical protein
LVQQLSGLRTNFFVYRKKNLCSKLFGYKVHTLRLVPLLGSFTDSKKVTVSVIFLFGKKLETTTSEKRKEEEQKVKNKRDGKGLRDVGERSGGR